MDRRIKVGIDHCTVFCRDLNTAASVFFGLGFVGDGNCTELSEEVKHAFVPSTRYVADNAYIECACFPKEMPEFYDFLKSDAAVHLMTLLTPDAEAAHKAIGDAGYQVADIDTTIRKGASHGTVTGTAKFLLVPVEGNVVPDTHLAYLEHCTRELLYQPTRWQHANGVRTLDEVTLVCGAEKADELSAKLTELDGLARSQTCEGGLRSLRFLDAETFAQEFGVSAHPERCIFHAFTFTVTALDAIRDILAGSSFPWQERDGKIYVDVMSQLNLVLVFQA